MHAAPINSQKITIESTQFLFKNAQKSFFTSIFVSAILLYSLKNSVSLNASVTWLSLLLLAYFTRAAVVYFFHRDDNKQQRIKIWLNRFRLSTVACGAAWGLATYYIFPVNDFELQAFLILALAGVCAGGLINLSVDSITASVFAGALWLVASPAYFLHESNASLLIFVLLAAFIVYVGLASKQLALNLIETIGLKLTAEQKEQEITHLTQRQSLHLEQTSMGVIECDAHLNITTWNKACTHIFGYAPAEMLGKPMHFLLPDLNGLANNDAIHLLTKGNGNIKQLKDVLGEIIHCELMTTALKNADDSVMGLAILVQDKTAFMASQQKIHQLAYFDTLTNLPNRGLLIDRINQSIAVNKRSKTYGMLAFIDLDHFKAINDIKGHDAGDHLLKVIAERLQTNLRKQDTAARLGGDEFVLVLSDIGKTKKQAEAFSKKIIEKIMHAIKVPVQYDGYQHQSSASVGVCLFNDDNLEADELLRRADVSMYLSKKQGRNCYQYYDDSLQPKYEYQLKLKHDLNHALENNQLQMYLQGQYNRDSDLIGAEVLLRWEHPELGMVMPNDFISIAEETGLIVPIGYWVIEQACLLLKQWEHAIVSEDFSLSVNVSAIQFGHPDFIEKLRLAIQQSGCDATKLCIELTESAVINSLEDLTDKMNRIRAMGVSLAIDDFGTGYSSLSVLKDLPLNELKIDRSFVKDFTTNPVDLTIVQTILQMGKNLNLRIVAEGVETESQMNYLSNYGCNMFQGYFFARPCSQADFEIRMHKIAIPKPLSRLPSKATNSLISSFVV